MDALSQILDTVEMRGSLYFPTIFRAPWALAVPADSNVCRFHVGVEGGCHLTAGDDSVWLNQGDLALVPHGCAHLLQDDPETEPTDLDRALQSRGYGGHGAFEWGAEGPVCRLVCGYFEFDKQVVHPILDALPAIVHVKAAATYDFSWVDQVMRFIGDEVRAGRPGGDVIARRLSEILFVQVLRHYAETATEPVPVLSGVTDPRLSRALAAMHADLERAWTVDDLAGEAAMSRTAFSQLFSDLIGRTPMRYLTDQRMREAARLLRAGRTAAEVAPRVGYRSDAAFSRRFKGFAGVGPGRYRRRAQASAL